MESYILVTNKLISSLLLEPKYGAYFDNIVNLKDYDWTLIPLWEVLINSSTFSSHFLQGNNKSMSTFLNTSQLMLSYHIALFH